MNLRYCAPTARWSNAVSVFAHVDARHAPSTYVLPALLPNLHVRLGGWSRYRFRDGRVRDAPCVTLVGVTSAAFSMEVGGDFEMVCTGLLPYGWHMLFGGSAHALADDIVDVGAVWSDSAADALWQQLAEATHLERMRDVLEGFLEARAARAAVSDDARIRVIQRWVEQPAPGLLADRLGVSQRHTGRVTQDLYGLGTKTLAMKYRALRVASAFAVHGERSLGDALVHYADQSHLIRDFQRFVGCTPCKFLAEGRTLACATIRGRWEAGVRAPMALLS